ncbi:MAG: sulfotransferase, partial [Gammaproteobacteria bacterium]|nr:sulfotransferase [Gammaproteobacteria bacterium]
ATDQDKVLLNRVRKTRKYYDKELFEKARDLGSESETPIFVVGMPRSGTTLIEQIICSHPQGAAAGELKEIAHIAAQVFPSDSLSDYGKELHNFLNKDTIRQYTDSYLQVLQNNRQHANRIVDKMPDNFFRLGLIKLLFPKAHIIHAIRNPLDTCLSCYFRPFTFVYWTYDLKWIGARYRFYRETMEYWKKILPANTIIDVDYDKLIENPAIQTRRIIESIGLPWDEHCLEFYKEQRAITTESVWQVRQPIYTSSSKRWMNYAPYLDALASELSNYLQPEDIEILKNHGIMTTTRKWGWKNLRNVLAK